jgi:carbonic anhydrase
MRRVLNFISSREHYVADAAVVWCFDYRFDVVFRKLLKRIGVLNTDSIRIAGGAKHLVSPERESDREFVLDQIRKSIKLHATKKVVLMLHSDCGAYGGLRAFNGDANLEASHHNSELQKAAAFLKSQIPELTVKAYFVDFDGVWEMEQQASDASASIT